jgi:hypothetical protein
MATVTIDANTPTNSQETITVMAGGQNPSGFLPVATGSDPNQQATAQATVIQAPKPTIVWGQGQSACQSATQVPATVVAGQQIAFTACIPQLPAGAQVQSESWTPSAPQGTAVAGYSITYDGNNVATSAQVQTISATTCGTGAFCTYSPFYWVDSGNSRQISFSYTLTNGSSNSASVSFNVDGPTGLNVVNQPSMAPAIVFNKAYSLPGIGNFNAPTLELGDGGASGNAAAAGIFLQVQASPAPHLPAARGTNSSYLWVQLISVDRITRRLKPSGSSETCKPNGFYPGAGNPNPAAPELDAVYPYIPGTVFGDSPSIPLVGYDQTTHTNVSVYSEWAQMFQATAYLLWDPALPSGCVPATSTPAGAATPSQCSGSIPVPIGYVQWTFSGDAVDTLSTALGDNGTSWKLCCGLPQPGTSTASNFQPTTAHPQWQAVVPTFATLPTYMKCQ